ncbi:transglutaminase N-terminal domain-containing protein [Pseudoflavonifractor phocaeensis]|uniref:transglutaminase N-terminal domain-containing protein n=1 Tax=Pseudoflavonifractor phocaeensis TaxID=1870988 RepID=UPI001958CDDF|nr:transglutaminase N-terminal domain-containing protein [Pseudoflavonifractor phocaeensis]MBM6927239.1 succinylglutamate desuccinylase/aspartoacylase family protein [Pseudoflavonifractor phocaeensis]
MSRRLSFYYDINLEFDAPVAEHDFTLRCVPPSVPGQEILDVTLELDPQVPYTRQRDNFGNLMQIGRISQPHDHFRYTVRGTARLDSNSRCREADMPICRYDTTTLNYNWQVWDTQAFSLYASATEDLDPAAARQGVEAILRFLAKKGFCRDAGGPGEETCLYHEDSLRNILSTVGGLLVHRRPLGETVTAGDVLAHIQDPCTGQVLERLSAPVSGRIFFRHRSRLIHGHEIAFRILQQKEAPQGAVL